MRHGSPLARESTLPCVIFVGDEAGGPKPHRPEHDWDGPASKDPRRDNTTVLFLDTSALLAAITAGPGRPVMLDALSAHSVWCASELALAEGLPAIDRLTDEHFHRVDLEDAFRNIWDWLYTIPIDRRCLDDAARIARSAPARLSDAIHLASASRLPGPVRFATVDPAQIGLAELVGFTPVSP